MRAPQQIVSDYRVTVNGTYGQRAANRARIQVSVGNPKYEGNKLVALIKWCASRFEETEIILSDTLQRYNYSSGDAAWDESRQEGDRWIERNAETLKGLKITRWDDLLRDDAFMPSMQKIESGLNNPEARKCLFEMAARFSTRNDIPPEKCIAFLKEELAVFHFLMQAPAVDIYAGTWVTNIFETLSLPVFENAQCIVVDFERKKTA